MVSYEQGTPVGYGARLANPSRGSKGASRKPSKPRRARPLPRLRPQVPNPPGGRTSRVEQGLRARLEGFERLLGFDELEGSNPSRLAPRKPSKPRRASPPRLRPQVQYARQYVSQSASQLHGLGVGM